MKSMVFTLLVANGLLACDDLKRLDAFIAQHDSSDTFDTLTPDIGRFQSGSDDVSFFFAEGCSSHYFVVYKKKKRTDFLDIGILELQFQRASNVETLFSFRPCEHGKREWHSVDHATGKIANPKIDICDLQPQQPPARVYKPPFPILAKGLDPNLGKLDFSTCKDFSGQPWGKLTLEYLESFDRPTPFSGIFFGTLRQNHRPGVIGWFEVVLLKQANGYKVLGCQRTPDCPGSRHILNLNGNAYPDLVEYRNCEEEQSLHITIDLLGEIPLGKAVYSSVHESDSETPSVDEPGFLTHEGKSWLFFSDSNYDCEKVHKFLGNAQNKLLESFHKKYPIFPQKKNSQKQVDWIQSTALMDRSISIQTWNGKTLTRDNKIEKAFLDERKKTLEMLNASLSKTKSFPKKLLKTCFQ